MNTVRTSTERQKIYEVPNRHHRPEEFNTWAERYNREGFNRRPDEAEQRIGQLEDRQWNSPIQNSKEFLKSEDNLRDLWNNIKQMLLEQHQTFAL